MKNILKKYNAETGQIINKIEIEIMENEVKIKENQCPILLSKNDRIVIEDKHYGTPFKILSRSKDDSINTKLNKPHVWLHESGYFGDSVFATLYSTFSQKVTKNRLEKAISKYFEKNISKYSKLSQSFKGNL